VLCTLNAVGHPEPPQGIRIVWGVLIACIAAGLLYAGGLKTIQMASIAAGLPISIFILLMSFTLLRTLRQESFTGLPTPSSGSRATTQETSQENSDSRGPLIDLGGAYNTSLHAKKAS